MTRRIAILEHAGASTSATGVRGRAIASFLRGRGHTVDFVGPSADEMRALARSRVGLRARVARRLSGRRALSHMWDLVADAIEPRVRAGRYDVVIARSQDVAGVLARGIPGRAIYDLANIGFLEEYHAWGSNLDDVEDSFDREMRVFESASFILSPHQLLTNYFMHHFASRPDINAKIRAVRLGAEPATRTARYSSPPRIVYAGSYYYIQDPYLLSELSRISPVPIDCYGFRDPNRRFLPSPLAYKGYRQTTDFLADYQFGLITVSRDALRQHSPSTKFPYYFAHGLPVLFPAWMKEGFEYSMCALPYTEATFAAVVEAASDATRWNEMSAAASALGRELSWSNVLQPLVKIVD